MGLGSGIRDPGSGKNPFRIPDPGVKKAPDPGSGSATLIFSITRQQNLFKTICANTESTVDTYLIFTTFKKDYSSHDTIPLGKRQYANPLRLNGRGLYIGKYPPPRGGGGGGINMA